MQNCYQANCYDNSYRMPAGPMEYAECSCHLAISNIPWQYYQNTYEPARALKIGTIFPELDMPFKGRRTCS